MIYSVHEAKTQFSKLLDMVGEGEDVVIIRHGEPAARLVVVKMEEKPVLGSMKGEISFKPGWEKAMTDQEADDFLAGK